jgi:putative iron-dependent peroxidase
MSLPSQPAILAPVPAAARFVTFGFRHASDPGRALVRLAAWQRDPNVVVGLGEPLLARAKCHVEGMRSFPADLALFPATQEVMWVAFTHPDRGAAFDAGRAFAAMLGDALRVVEEIDGFVYRGGRDLSGFEDGTEDPKGDAAVAAAIVQGRGAGLDGASFVAVQRWVHDLSAADAMAREVRESIIGRRLVGNEEIDDAPLSAHVKRTAQESFEPEPSCFVDRCPTAASPSTACTSLPMENRSIASSASYAGWPARRRHRGWAHGVHQSSDRWVLLLPPGDGRQARSSRSGLLIEKLGRVRLAQKKFPIVNSNTFVSSKGRGLKGKPHSKRSGPSGENQRMPNPYDVRISTKLSSP